MFPILLVASYLLGAIPVGLLIGLSRGVDIRQHGSRNIGSTNAGRVLGRKPGLICLYLDILKGLLPTLAASFLLVHPPLDAWMLGQWMLVGLAAVIGHTFPIYLGFRGGKGVATTIGVALGVYPFFTVAMVAALLAYFIARTISGTVSLGSLAIAVVFPLASAAYLLLMGHALAEHWPLIAVAAALGLLIIVRHAANIARLMRGQELLVRTDEEARSGAAKESHP